MLQPTDEKMKPRAVECLLAARPEARPPVSDLGILWPPDPRRGQAGLGASTVAAQRAGSEFRIKDLSLAEK